MVLDSVDDLIELGSSTIEAVSVVLEKSDGGSEEITWSDVNDVLSSEQWGKLINKEILVEGTTGFTVSNPEETEKILNKYRKQEGKGSETGWSNLDKVVGMVGLVFFAGYFVSDIRGVIVGVDRLFLSSLDGLFPFYLVIVLLSIFTGLYSTMLQSWLIDSQKLKEYKKKVEKLQEKKKEVRGNDDKDISDIIDGDEEDIMNSQVKMMKLQFRPTVWIMLITIPVFLWMRWKINGGHIDQNELRIILPFFGSKTWKASLIGSIPTWIFWYFLCSLGSRQVLKKVFNLDMLSIGNSSVESED